MQKLPSSDPAPAVKPFLVFSHGLGATSQQGSNFFWRAGFNKFEFYNAETEECIDTGNWFARCVSALIVTIAIFARVILWWIRERLGWNPEPVIQHIAPFLWRSNLAQDGDIDSILDSAMYLSMTKPNIPYALFGVSKGALATLRALATMPTVEATDANDKTCKPHPPFNKPRFILLDNCPDTIANVVYWRYGKWWGEVCLVLLSLFTKFDPMKDFGIKDYLDDLIALDVPIAFVISGKDTSVPNDCTYRILTALASTPLANKIHVLQLDNAGHNVYNTASPIEWSNYSNFVDGLYEKYCSF